MKPLMIALMGPASCGKTKTLVRVISGLEKQPGAKMREKKPHNEFDWLAIIVIGRTTIGIFTDGDPPGDDLEREIDYFIKSKCEIIVCACRTRRDSTKGIVLRYEASVELHLMRQAYDGESEAGQLRIQEDKAQEILDLIMQRVGDGSPSA